MGDVGSLYVVRNRCFAIRFYCDSGSQLDDASHSSPRCGQPGSEQRGPLSSSDPRTVDDFEVRPVGLGSEGVCLSVKR